MTILLSKLVENTCYFFCFVLKLSHIDKQGCLSLKFINEVKIMGNKKIIYLTEEGLKDLQAELDDLINVKRPANILSIKEARSLGDLSENADYDAAKNEQAQIEGRIKTIEKMLENVEIIKDVPKDKVGLGSTVGIKYVDDPDDTDEYKIVGSQEADPFEGRISNESPIAKALMNHKLGDVITVESPNGNYEVEITAIK